MQLTNQQLLQLFLAGRHQGDDEAQCAEVGCPPTVKWRDAFIRALQDIYYEEHRDYPTKDEIIELFQLKQLL